MSTLHCSFVIYLDEDSAAIPSFLKDVRGFFQKFPLNYELVAVVEKGAQGCLKLLREAQTESPPREKITILTNDRKLRRAESLRRGLDAAEAPYLVIADPLMATPLGDLFKILQNLMGETSVDMCWGDRTTKKGSPFLDNSTPRHHLEHLFNGILRERKHTPLKDPLCETGGLKKTAWQKLSEKMKSHTLRGWYLSPYILKEAQKQALNVIEVPVHDSGQSSLSFSLWRERWNLLRQSIF